MIGGQLRQRIQLQSSSHTRGDNGEDILSWATTTTVWARAEVQNQGEALEGEKRTATETVKFTVRYSSTTQSLSPANRLIWGTTTYNITGVIPDERKISITIMAELKE